MQKAPQGGEGLVASLQRLRQTLAEARRYQDFAWLLACAVAYQAGISVVIALAAIYAESVLGFKQTQTMALIFIVNLASALGAFGFGYWQDRIGHRIALAVTLAGWILMTALAFLATSQGLFWVAAVIAGLCMGSSQSAGRAMAGLLAPADRRAEFFWAVDLCGTAVCHRRAADLRLGDLGDGRQSPSGHLVDGRLLCGRPTAFAPRGYGAWRARSRVKIERPFYFVFLGPGKPGCRI